MFRHTLLLIYRNFKRFKTTFFINLIGLSTGIACTLLIYLWVADEWTFDRYHEKDGRLFQVMENSTTTKGVETRSQTQLFLAEVLAAELPEIESAVTVTPPHFFSAFTLTANNTHVEGVGKYVGKDFFSMFSYGLINGNASEVLADKNSVVLSERIAKRLFSDISDIVGKDLEYQMQTLKKRVTITGVFKDLPINSSEQFDIILSFEAFSDIMNFNKKTLDWGNVAPFLTYVTTKEGTDIDQFNDKLGGFLESKSGNLSHRTLFLRPFADKYLFGKYENGKVSGGRIEYIKLFSIIAAFILLIACVNFMNLSTAKASRRMKEIGIKKVIGAKRTTLIFQYLGESLLMSFLSLFLAILVVDLFLPQFNSITGKDLVMNFDRPIITTFLSITLFTGLVAGSYPAMHLSGINTAKVLKGQFNTSMGELWVRKGLVIFQFSVSVIFIVALFVVSRQIDLIQTKDLGYEKDNLLYFETSGMIVKNPEAFLYEIKQMPGVVNASSMLDNFVFGRRENIQFDMYITQVNYDFIETLGIEIREGRSFSRNFGSDTLQFIYNEAAIEYLGIKDPVGKILPSGYKIVGVVKNFIQSIHEAAKPHRFILSPYYAMTILVKIKGGMEKTTIQNLEKFYKSFNPGYVFKYKFLDEAFQAQYAAELKVASLSKYFAGVAITISCLGLFGLASFTAERRIKEIGVRKVLGSSVTGIVYLLSVDFTKIVLISIIIALPVSFLIAKQWLDSFAFKISLEWWYFVGSGLLALFIAWLTVGAQAIKAARVNPVKCLRDE
ncbi:MAG: ABC transporter permease [Cyclobacteriaceae bacterium]